MNDIINRANLPSVLNGVTMSECDKVIEPFLEERSCDEVWHTVRALRDFYDWVMSENAVEPCKDAISRDNAIKEIGNAFDMGDCYCDRHSIIGLMHSLPSVTVEPKSETESIIETCVLVDIEDCVDRYSVLAELDPQSYEYKAVKELPSVIPKPKEVEPKHGKWKINNNGWAYCPECGSFGLESYSFCPYCGTKLTDKNVFVKGINVPSKTYESKWIPCKERLPEVEKKVWIQTKRGKVCFAMYEDGTISENDSDWHWYDLDFENWDEENDCGIVPEGWWEWTEFHPDCEFDCPVDEKVVAWQPLPEPYMKGVSDE